jgi:hypothetical protein
MLPKNAQQLVAGDRIAYQPQPLLGDTPDAPELGTIKENHRGWVTIHWQAGGRCTLYTLDTQDFAVWDAIRLLD